MKELVIPGDKLEGRPNAYFYKSGEGYYSEVFGILEKTDNAVRIVPLSGKYMPRLGDYVVGIVSDIKRGGVLVDIGTPYVAFMPTRDNYSYKDLVSAEVMEIDEVKSATLTNGRKLFGGDVVEVSPIKVPRLIGKNNSMLNLLKEKTGCMMFIGRNGRVWIKGEKTHLLIRAIKKIDEEAHTSGLTERMETFFKELTEKGE